METLLLQNTAATAAMQEERFYIAAVRYLRVSKGLFFAAATHSIGHRHTNRAGFVSSPVLSGDAHQRFDQAAPATVCYMECSSSAEAIWGT